VGFSTATSANDRPSDPFGNHTIELNNEAPLFGVWKFLSDQLLLDKTRFHFCIEQSNTSCPEVFTLLTIVDEARQNQGKALLGHLNRSSGIRGFAGMRRVPVRGTGSFSRPGQSPLLWRCGNAWRTRKRERRLRLRLRPRRFFDSINQRRSIGV